MSTGADDDGDDDESVPVFLVKISYRIGVELGFNTHTE